MNVSGCHSFIPIAFQQNSLSGTISTRAPQGKHVMPTLAILDGAHLAAPKLLPKAFQIRVSIHHGSNVIPADSGLESSYSDPSHTIPIRYCSWGDDAGFRQ